MDGKKATVAAVHCPEYEPALLRKAVREAVAAAGGWPEKVLNARKILLKPNLLSPRPPEEAVTTHPEFARAVACELRSLGGKDLWLGDSCAGEYSQEELWDKTGMAKVCAEEDVRLLRFENISRRRLDSAGSVPVLAELGAFGAVINLPKLKTHALTKITGATKNTFGLMPGIVKAGFHGSFPSPRKMSVFLADLYCELKPDFTVMDAVESMDGNGPANGEPYRSELIFAGADAAAVDACACRLYRFKPEEIPMLRRIAGRGGGIAADELIERAGDGWELLEEKSKKARRTGSGFIHSLPEFAFHPLSLLLSCRPVIDQKLCVRCGVCAGACSQKAICLKSGSYLVEPRKCILCMCCMEACKKHAVLMDSPAMRMKRFFGRIMGR